MNNAAPSTRSLAEIIVKVGIIKTPARLYSGVDAKSGVERHTYLPVPVMVPLLDDDGEQQVDEITGEPQFVQKTREVEHEDGTIEHVNVFEDHLVGRMEKDKETEKPLTDEERRQTVSKIETEYGPVWVDDHEIERLFSVEPNMLTITQFQPQHLFYQGNYVPKGLNYLEPAKTGSGAKKIVSKSSVEGLATLYAAMRKEGVVGIGELTTRGVPKPVIVTPDGKVWLVNHTDSVRAQREFPEVEVPEADVAVMAQIMNVMKKDEVADLTDVRSALINNFASEKAAAGDFDRSVEPELDAPAVVESNMSEVLAAALAAAKAQIEGAA